MRRWITAAVLGFVWTTAGAASAQTCATYPNVLQNGTAANADQVMANFNCAALTGHAVFTGNVAIGAATADHPLVVEAGGQPQFSQGTFTNTGGNGAVSLLAWSAADSEFLLGADWANNAYTARANSASAIWDVYGITQFVHNTGLTPGAAFSWNPAAMAIDGNGRVGIDTTSPSLTFYVNGSSGGTGAWTVASDARLKTNISTIANALGLVERLRGVRFQWRANAERRVGQALHLPAGETEIGLVAQEVAAVVPEAVAAPKTPDGIYGLKEASLVAVLVEAVKEQQAEIGALRGEVDALKRQAADARTTVASN
jgi:hypothetical protein